MKVLICGSRNWADFPRVLSELRKLQCDNDVEEVIQGEARGADAFGRAAAYQLKIPVRSFHANWDFYGRTAGLIRNLKMLNEGKPDLVLAFQRNESRGTSHMIKIARDRGVPVKVIRWDETH